MLAAQAIKAGDADVIVAGGKESMSSAPHYVYGMRGGIKAGNQTMVDGMIHDGLWDSFGDCHMGEYAEYTAKKAGVSRQDQDAFALRQPPEGGGGAARRASSRRRSLPVQMPGKGGPTIDCRGRVARARTPAPRRWRSSSRRSGRTREP